MGYIANTKHEDSFKLNKKRIEDVQNEILDNLTKIKSQCEECDHDLIIETSYLINAVIRYAKRVNNGKA